MPDPLPARPATRPSTRLMLPDSPCVVAGLLRASVLTADGELLDLPADEAGHALRNMAPPVLVHAPATLRRLGLRSVPTLDLLELFAFVLPARPVAPTPRGMALALDLPPPIGLEAAEPDAGRRDARAARAPRGRARPRDPPRRGRAGGADGAMRAGAGRASCSQPSASRAPRPSRDALQVWKRLPEWEDEAPPPPPASHAVQPHEARRRLAAMLGPHAEQRPGQSDYAAAAAAAFAPRERRGDPHLVLAEAGTGTGKTLGYIAPASLWAERNKGAVWISTFTRHLQRQIDAELARLYPDPAERRRRVVVRKGRENYLCLLNLEDAVHAALGGRRAGDARAARPGGALGAGDRRRRHPGRRPAGLVRRAVRHRAASPGSPTGAASASTRPARIGGNASSSTRSAAPAAPNWWSPTTRW